MTMLQTNQRVGTPRPFWEFEMSHSVHWRGFAILCLAFCCRLSVRADAPSAVNAYDFIERSCFESAANEQDRDPIRCSSNSHCDAIGSGRGSFFEDWGVDFGGWMSGGLTLNGDGNRSGNGNAPYGYNNVSDGAVLNQLWLFGEKPIDEDAGFDWGFRIDYLFGTDGPDNQAFADQSWDFGWDSSRDYGSAIPQCYGDLKINDLTVRVGYFLTPIGWENVPTTQNFFYSHSYTFYYSEPNTHSGVLATYDLNDRISIQGGWTLGIDSSFANYLQASTFLGGISLTLSESTSVNWALVAGDWGDGTARRGAPSNEGDVYIHSLILEHSFSDRCDYVLHHDYGVNSGLSTASTRWYAIVQYLTYRVTDDWHVGARVEWFRDGSGVRLGSGLDDVGDFYEATVGVNWFRGDHLVVRPEVRWDWSGGAGLPYDDGTEDEFFTYAINAVLTF